MKKDYDKKVKTQVEKLLNEDNFGHGMEHINRVLELSLRFAKKVGGLIKRLFR